MSEYGREEYLKDLSSPEIRHTESREHFKSFYEELGKDEAQKAQQHEYDRMRFVIPKGKILELGSHWGFNLIHFAYLGYECTGVELSKNLIDFGKTIVVLLPENVQKRITFINSFIEDFVPQEKYDTIILTETLEHVIDPLTILKKAEECLKPDGKLYISVPSHKDGTNSHVRGINPLELKGLLSQTNLCVEYWHEDCYERFIVWPHTPMTVMAVVKFKENVN